MTVGGVIAFLIIWKFVLVLFGAGGGCSSSSSGCGLPGDASSDCACGHVHDGGRGCGHHGCD